MENLYNVDLRMLFILAALLVLLLWVRFRD